MLTDMIGKKFDKLLVLERVEDFISPTNGVHHPQYLCQCDCGNTVIIIGRYLRRRKKASCGCESSLMLYHHKKNVFDLTGEYGVGYTTNTNQEFYFDLDDYDLIKDYCWWETTNGYITTHNNILLHRLILQPSKNKVVDHINNNKKDNRRCNLREATRGQNNINIGVRNNNSSGYTGVFFNKNKNKWEARISIDGKDYRLGRYNNIQDAIDARHKGEIKYFGEWAYNFNINKNNAFKDN